jgi:hypothetical protein
MTGRLNSLYRPARAEGDAGEQRTSLQGPHGHVIE